MKKIFLIAAMMLGVAAAAIAQPRAVGLRGGYGIEVSYQHTLSDKFAQVDLGLAAGGFNLAGTYNWMLATPQWTDRGEWGFYAGPGASIGSGVMSLNSYGYAFHVDVAGMVGLEYTFWFPLQLSVDIRPQLGVGFGPKAGIHATGFWPAFSARYKF